MHRGLHGTHLMSISFFAKPRVGKHYEHIFKWHVVRLAVNQKLQFVWILDDTVVDHFSAATTIVEKANFNRSAFLQRFQVEFTFFKLCTRYCWTLRQTWINIIDKRQHQNSASTLAETSGPPAQDRYCAKGSKGGSKKRLRNHASGKNKENSSNCGVNVMGNDVHWFLNTVLELNWCCAICIRQYICAYEMWDMLDSYTGLDECKGVPRLI